MKITKNRLKQIIKEELETVVNEQNASSIHQVVSPYKSQFNQIGEKMADALAAKGAEKVKLTQDVYNMVNTRKLLDPVQDGELFDKLSDFYRANEEPLKRLGYNGIVKVIEWARQGLVLAALQSMNRKLNSLGYERSAPENASNKESELMYSTWTKKQ